MHLAFSTLGCPELTVAEAVALARTHGYSGIEFRSGPGATIDPTASLTKRRVWRDALVRGGVRALSVATYVKLCADASDEETVNAAIEQARLAHDLEAPWVRVFPGGPRGVPVPADVEARAGRRLEAIAAAIEGLGVRIAVETHDSHPTAADVLRLIGNHGGPVHVIWDMLHPWLAGEEPEETARLLQGRVAYVQVKDVAARDRLDPLPPGSGVLPLEACLHLVREQNLSSWVSWEYERLWFPDAAPLPELAAGTAAFLARVTSARG